MWPGFGDNMRVLEWIIARTKDQAPAMRTPIGYVPEVDGLNREGLALSDSTLQSLCSIDPLGWKKEMKDIEQYLLTYGDRLPAAFRIELKQIME